MSYKFSMGPTVLSGTLTQVSGTMDLVTDGILSASADVRVGDALEVGPAGEYGIDRNGQADIASMGTNWTNASRTVADIGLLTTGSAVALGIRSVDIDGGAIDGAVIGANSAAAGTFAALVGTSLSVSDGNITNVGSIALDSITADDGSSFSMGSNWTNASRTVADMGIVTTIDINGGSIDGAVIGAASAQAGTFTTLVGTSLNLQEGNITNAGSIACDSISIDTAAVGLDIIFSGNTGTNKISLKDNLASALDIVEDSTSYMKFATSNGSELITFGKKLQFGSSASDSLEVDTNMIFSSAEDVEFMVKSGTGTLQCIGQFSGSGNFIAGSTALFNGNFTIKAGVDKDFNITADANYAQGADGILYQDATDGLIKASTNDAFLTAIAGSGLSVSGNKLVTDSAFNLLGIGNADETLIEGFNYGSASFTANRTWTLPASPTAGDIVRVKAPASLGGYILYVAPGTGDQIDDQGANVKVELRADHGAINLVAISNAAWKIF